MIRRIPALLLAALFVLALFAPDVRAEEDDTVSVFFGNISVELEMNGLDEEKAASIAKKLLYAKVDEQYESIGDVGGVSVETEAIEPSRYAPQTSSPLRGNHGHVADHVHSLVTTTAYFTEHLVYNTDPRCVVSTVNVTVCRDCDYIEKNVLSTERVSRCHPGGHALRGDVNRDGRLNAKDVTALMRAIVGVRYPAALTVDRSAADLDKSGRLNAKDVTLLMRIIVNQ